MAGTGIWREEECHAQALRVSQVAGDAERVDVVNTEIIAEAFSSTFITT